MATFVDLVPEPEMPVDIGFLMVPALAALSVVGLLSSLHPRADDRDMVWKAGGWTEVDMYAVYAFVVVKERQ